MNASTATVELGDRVHVMTRRNFERDLRRHFVGEVVAVNGSQVRLEGYTFICNPATNDYVKRPDRRIRIFDLSDSGQIVNIMPNSVRVENVEYRISAEQTLVVTDGTSYSLDINEFGMTA